MENCIRSFPRDLAVLFAPGISIQTCVTHWLVQISDGQENSIAWITYFIKCTFLCDVQHLEGSLKDYSQE